MPNAYVTASVLLLLLAGCRPRQTGPDANYEQGARIYQLLYAQQLDDAYGDPKMSEAEALLNKVDPRSVDADSAKRMLASIQSGRAALAKQRAERDRRTAGMATAPIRYPQLDPVQIIAASTPPPPPDAGPVDPYGPGASLFDINSQSGGCLTAGEPFREQGTDAKGTVYRVAKSPQCAERLPGLVGEAVLVSDGKIYRRVADPTIGKAPPPAANAAAGAGPSANARQPAPAAPANAPAAAAADGDAGVTTQIYVPGMPLPEGVAPPPPPAQQQPQ